jgi:hypothetical protein
VVAITGRVMPNKTLNVSFTVQASFMSLQKIGWYLMKI